MHFINNFLKSLELNLKRRPLAIVSAYLATIFIIFLIGNRGDYDYIAKASATLILGYFLFGALYFSKNRLVLLFGLVALGLYYYFYAKYFSISYFLYQSIYLDIAVFFMFFWMPFLNKKESNFYFYSWFKGVIYSFGASFFLSILIIIGLFLAYGAIDKLLGLDLSAKIYGYSATIVFGVFGANYFLYLLDNIELDSKIDKIESLLAKYILPIFTVGYFLILYIYTAKIVIYNDWPKGYLAWFIVLFTLIAFLSYLFLTPYKTTNWRRLFLVAVIPQAIMLLLAVYKRVEKYSFTEQRYMLMVYGFLLIATVLYFLLKKDAKYKYLFMASTFILIFLQIGPTSSWYIGKKAQEIRLKKALDNYSVSRSKDLEYQISNIIDYLTDRYGIDGVKRVLNDIVKKYKSENRKKFAYDISNYITKEIGFKYVKFKPPKRKFISNSYVYYSNITGYDWFLQSGYNRYEYVGNRKVAEIEEIGVKVLFRENFLILKQNNKEIRVDLTKNIKKIFDSENVKDLTINYNDSQVKLKLIINHISLEANNIISMNFSMFFSFF